jgi:hypothetical protein
LPDVSITGWSQTLVMTDWNSSEWLVEILNNSPQRFWMILNHSNIMTDIPVPTNTICLNLLPFNGENRTSTRTILVPAVKIISDRQK